MQCDRTTLEEEQKIGGQVSPACLLASRLFPSSHLSRSALSSRSAPGRLLERPVDDDGLVVQRVAVESRQRRLRLLEPAELDQRIALHEDK